MSNPYNLVKVMYGAWDLTLFPTVSRVCANRDSLSKYLKHFTIYGVHWIVIVPFVSTGVLVKGSIGMVL